MKYIVSPSVVTVVIDGRSHSMPRPADELIEALRGCDEDRVRQIFGVDPLLDQLRTYGGHLDETSRYFVKNAKGRYWRAPRKGTTDQVEEAHPYLPCEVRAVIGPLDQVVLEKEIL